MQISVLSQMRRPGLLKRLQGLGYRVRVEQSDRIVSLDTESQSLVYLVPFDDTHLDSWPGVRVNLARASRFYVVVGSGLATVDIMDAARDGAHDVIDEADDDVRWSTSIEHAAHSQALWWQLYGSRSSTEDKNLVGSSRVMQSLRDSISRLGPTPATVLAMGESGTGKERVAEAIHAASGRGAFVTVNCAAIPAELMESELFGVEKGAYTGATRDRPGLVEEAASGTLFLDEIGEMDIALQPKLLRFLETRRTRRVGSTKEYVCEARVISATNRDLKADSESGRFRLDLFYRLSEVVLNLPPLRQRTQDIPELVQVFLDAAAVRFGKNFERIEPELIYKFQVHDWPGNVRELKQVIDRLAIHYDGPVMRAAWWDLQANEAPPVSHGGQNAGARQTRSPFGQSRSAFGQAAPSQPEYPTAQSYPQMAGYAGQQPILSYSQSHQMPSRKEKLNLARRLINESGGDLTWVAAQLGIHPTTLYRWRKSGKV